MSLNPSVFERLPYPFARRHGVAATGRGDHVDIAHRAALHPRVIAELQRHFRAPLRFRPLEDAAFDALLQQLYDESHGAASAMADLGDELDLARIAADLPQPQDLLDQADDAPIIRLINALLAEAVRENASDIHVESFENRLSVRLRVDGVLRETIQPPRALAPVLVSRIKVMAKLDIAEKRLPQDGRISLRLAGRAVDVRVSTLPAGQGERVVLRLLDKQAGRLDLPHLGMAPTDEQRLDDLIRRPHGIILVTGPTGSGKTTTLYAALTRLNDRSRNIMTVEDPIEYFLDGINQTQVNNKVELSFARGLRAMLRQDPDVVMVGEIRDRETADIAVQASLTGHLVLSTLHTNSAIGAVTRLRDMGVEPFLLASSLVGLVAQRLVRRLCDHCKRPHPATAAECALLGVDPSQPPIIYLPVGCDRCHGRGYRGRGGIFEVVSVDEPLQHLIHEGAAEAELTRYARQSSAAMVADGLRRVLLGETSLEEVVRVGRDR